MRTFVVTAMVCVCVAALAWVMTDYLVRSGSPDDQLIVLGSGAQGGPPAPQAAGKGVDALRPTGVTKPLPELSFTDANGKPMTLADFRGKTVLLNLWATWCAPCIKEMPDLDQLQQKLGSDKFVVIALSLDRGGLDVVRPFYEKAGLTALGIYLDPAGETMKRVSGRGLPTTLLIDGEGREVSRVEGVLDWAGEEVLGVLRWWRRANNFLPI